MADSSAKNLDVPKDNMTYVTAGLTYLFGGGIALSLIGILGAVGVVNLEFNFI